MNLDIERQKDRIQILRAAIDVLAGNQPLDAKLKFIEGMLSVLNTQETTLLLRMEGDHVRALTQDTDYDAMREDFAREKSYTEGTGDSDEEIPF